MGKFIPKITNSAILGAVSPHLKVTVVKFGKGCGPGESLPTPNFVKIAEGDIPLFGKFIQKIPILAISAPVIPHFLSHNHEVWHQATDLGHPPCA